MDSKIENVILKSRSNSTKRYFLNNKLVHCQKVIELAFDSDSEKK
jgi:hypothetical protein